MAGALLAHRSITALSPQLDRDAPSR